MAFYFCAALLDASCSTAQRSPVHASHASHRERVRRLLHAAHTAPPSSHSTRERKHALFASMNKIYTRTGRLFRDRLWLRNVDHPPAPRPSRATDCTRATRPGPWVAWGTRPPCAHRAKPPSPGHHGTHAYRACRNGCCSEWQTRLCGTAAGPTRQTTHGSRLHSFDYRARRSHAASRDLTHCRRIVHGPRKRRRVQC